jgi:hypothetical protein
VTNDKDKEIGTISPAELEIARQELEKLEPVDYYHISNQLELALDGIELGEAGGVAWCVLIGKNGGQVTLTERGITSIDALEHLSDAIAYAKQNYGMRVRRSTRKEIPPPHQGGSQRITLPTPPPQQEYIDDQLNTTPQTNHPGEILNLRCVKITTTPLPDGRCKVDFFGNQHKQPVDQFKTLSFTAKPEDMLQALSQAKTRDEPWDLSMFSTVREIWMSDMIVDYRLSEKLTSAGNPYKDFLSVRASTTQE